MDVGAQNRKRWVYQVKIHNDKNPKCSMVLDYLPTFTFWCRAKIFQHHGSHLGMIYCIPVIINLTRDIGSHRIIEGMDFMYFHRGIPHPKNWDPQPKKSHCFSLFLLIFVKHSIQHFISGPEKKKTISSIYIQAIHIISRFNSSISKLPMSSTMRGSQFEVGL